MVPHSSSTGQKGRSAYIEQRPNLSVDALLGELGREEPNPKSFAESNFDTATTGALSNASKADKREHVINPDVCDNSHQSPSYSRPSDRRQPTYCPRLPLKRLTRPARPLGCAKPVEGAIRYPHLRQSVTVQNRSTVLWGARQCYSQWCSVSHSEPAIEGNLVR